MSHMSGEVQTRPNGGASGNKKKEIYNYEAPWVIYGMDWSLRPDRRYRLALGSFIEEYSNQIRIVQLNEEIGEFVEIKTFNHPYPSTKIQWIPDPVGNCMDLLATSGDYLRIWRVEENNEITMAGLLNNLRYHAFCSPLTSFDWNATDPNLLVTSSIDTTCTVWALETQQPIASHKVMQPQEKTQLIAHDTEVFDVAFSSGSNGNNIFATVGADASLRLFDLRQLVHSMIMYEDPNHSPLLRLAWNKQDPHYIACLASESTELVLLDTRRPTEAVRRLKNHQRFINGMAWAPHSGCHISTAADDCQALIWDIQPKVIGDPILAYSAKYEINQIKWGILHPEWIAICFKNYLELLRV